MTVGVTGSVGRLDLGQLTTKTVTELLASGHDIDVILPLGALEQHGPHLPLSTDQRIADALAQRVAHQVGDCLVVPSVPFGDSAHHLSFAGTVAVAPDTLLELLCETIESFLAHGFASVYVVTGHAGNVGAMKQAAARLDKRVVSFADWPAQRAAVHAVAQEKLGLDPEVVGTHAGHFETSIMMLLNPELVDLTVAVPGFIGPAADASRVLRAEGMEAVSPNGVIGDPRGANAAAGEQYLAALVTQVVDGVRAHRAGRSQSLGLTSR